jgi:hypothetical protein
MNPQVLVEMAFAYLGDLGVAVKNTARSILFARMSARQRELFTFASAIDWEFFGECVVATLDGGGVDLALLETQIDMYPIESIQLIRIADPGASEYESGTRVSLVRLDDGRAFPPRATLRSHILRGYADDLAEVASVIIWYARRPHEIRMDGTVGGPGVVELPEPFHVLLALDLAKYILAREPETNGSAAMATIQALEDQTMASFGEHIRGSYRALEARFG